MSQKLGNSPQSKLHSDKIIFLFSSLQRKKCTVAKDILQLHYYIPCSC